VTLLPRLVLSESGALILLALRHNIPTCCAHWRPSQPTIELTASKKLTFASAEAVTRR
jgi:hypothetical protein